MYICVGVNGSASELSRTTSLLLAGCCQYSLVINLITPEHNQSFVLNSPVKRHDGAIDEVADHVL